MYPNLSDPPVNSILCLLLLSFAIPLNLWTMLVVLALCLVVLSLACLLLVVMLQLR
jgi:hypothetical protein